ncbi:hypothetical protein P154DRAFT_516837 [Amniculicola lignicola CBS 123094]|uniref:Uncharacterized protein n=1 Tax=Amniculicola lignicola CBS 123094 TaxID=1392246 RepID=A0A6A5X5A7_9PLEO|nr:hypothetical protein P154DRAFT_516837 [Amniculicola lignicola CBS 123094]
MADDHNPVMSATMGSQLSPTTPRTASTMVSSTGFSHRSESQGPPPLQPLPKEHYAEYGGNTMSTYPELAPKPESHAYIYPVPEVAPLYKVDTNPPIPYVAKKQRRWNWWPYLIIYGLLVAVVAALIGGFVGKTLEHNDSKKEITRLNNSLNSLNDASCSTNTSPPSRTTSPTSSPSSTSSSSASATPTPTTANIPRPTTGCNPVDKQASFRSLSTSLDLPFDTLCWTGWTQDDLYPLYTITPSDCFESCAAYNSFKGEDDRSCVGGGFIPDWVNKTVAMAEIGMPFNCFLKSNTTALARNDRENTEVVSLCMPGMCKDAFTTT